MRRSARSTRNARKLRKASTDFERRLWRNLRARRFEDLKFRRQHPIDRYIVDFCSLSSRLVIELDGGQHAEQQERDERRTRKLEALGYLVVRFWNSDSLEAVLEEIWRVAVQRRSRSSPPHPPASPAASPQGGRGEEDQRVIVPSR